MFFTADLAIKHKNRVKARRERGYFYRTILLLGAIFAKEAALRRMRSYF